MAAREEFDSLHLSRAVRRNLWDSAAAAVAAANPRVAWVCLPKTQSGLKSLMLVRSRC